MKKYDVVIIGAGPCGIACALELSENNKNVLLLEQGNHYESRYCNVDAGNICKNCKKCNVMTGFGGCVHYGDSIKLTAYPSGKALYSKLKNEYDSILLKACKYWDVNMDRDFLVPIIDSKGTDFEIKRYPVCVMNSLKVKHNIEKWYKLISCSQWIDLKMNEEMVDLKRKDNGFEILTAQKNVYYAEKVVLSVGRGGMLWLKRNLKKIDINSIQPKSTIGLRFEMPKKYLTDIGQKHPDLKIRKKHNLNKYKTFCFCGGEHGGRIKFVNYGEYVLLDGHVLTDTDINCEYGNFALLTQIQLDDSSNIPYSEYIKSIINQYKEMNNGYPICQKYNDFKNACSTKCGEYNTKSSVKCVPYGDVYRLFDTYLASFCQVAEEIFHYILEGKEINYNDFLEEVYVVGLEMEGLWDQIETSDGFLSSCDSIYFGGDCGGESQGALQATMTGIKIATELCENNI